MKATKTYLPALAAMLALAAPAQAGLITEPTRIFQVGFDLADLQDPPLSFLQTITDSAIVSLTRVEVGLRLVGSSSDAPGFASEMFVALNKDLSQSSILLNQVGLSADDPVGAGYDGWDVAFSNDAPAGDVHLAALESGLLTGLWAPDGRTDPTDDASRTQLLDVFLGGMGNGDWRLVVGDLALGGTMRLESWSLTFTGDDGVGPVPTPESGSVLALWGVAMLGLGWSRARSTAKP